MKTRTLVVLLIGTIVTILALRWMLYERIEVPDINWRGNYDKESVDAYGYGVFYNVLGQVYSDSTEVSLENLPTEKDSVEGRLYVMVDQMLGFSPEEIAHIMNATHNGASFFISSPYLAFDANDITVIRSDGVVGLDSLIINGERMPFVLRVDTSMHHKLINTLPTFQLETESDVASVDFTNDTYAFACVSVGAGKICFTKSSKLLSNIHSDQAYYLPLMNWIVSQYDVHSMHWVTRAKPQTSSSPLKYLLSQRSFRWSYYLLVLAGILFMIFGGKRRRKVIPIINPKENTSLEYVRTIAKLHRSKNNPHVIAQRLVDNFYYYVEHKYYIHKDDPDFWGKLEKKSTVDTQIIHQVKTRTEASRVDAIEKDSELQSMYIALENFKKHTS